MSFPIVDLHCDLLSFLQTKPERTPFDPLSRVSHAQMKSGGVRLQTLAIFTYPKKGSTDLARQQIEIFSHLPLRYRDHYAFFRGEESLDHPSDKIFILPAFENASGFCEEGEAIELGLARLQHLYEKLKRILYISLTWDGENRFGGGNGSTIGLKEDGKHLLRWMDGKKIAVDLSHTSDLLAHDILNFIDKHKLDICVIASHSNFRSVTEAARNLPDEIALEIIKRRGIIGFNFFSVFLGSSTNILKHVEHGLKLGARDALCFGADFFCDQDFPGIEKKYKSDILFFDELSDASKYPAILQLFSNQLTLPHPQLKAIASDNFLAFAKRLWS